MQRELSDQKIIPVRAVELEESTRAINGVVDVISAYLPLVLFVCSVVCWLRQ